MRAIGFRVEPKAVHYAVIDVDPNKKVVVDHGSFHPPTTYTEPECLKWYRSRIAQEVDRYKPTHAGVRYPEVFGRRGITNSDYRRLRIEGVILEALASCGVTVFGGNNGAISSAMGTASAKEYKERGEVRGLDLGKFSTNCKEAALVALASTGQKK